MNRNIVTSVSEYIKVVTDNISDYLKQKKIVVFRGECKDYKETSCVPNIFRQNVLYKNKKFEKNLFDEMTANNLSIGSTYLEKAISAQHDGFPSRLLDVSYNCLVALYFACTPYYHKPENEYDKDNGKVFIFGIEKMFCPTGENIINAYDKIINGNDKSFIKCQLFGKNHKLIDHIKTNKRIIAQQGAFILFQGNEYEKIPSRLCKTIEIDGNSKHKIREELKVLFGIDTATIYPIAENFVDNMIKKSDFVDTSNFSLKNELNMILYNLEEDFEYYIKTIFDEITKCKNKKYVSDKVVSLEYALKEYYLGCIELKECVKNDDEKTPVLNNFIDMFNDTIYNNIIFINSRIKDLDISIFTDDFILKKSNGENDGKKLPQDS